MSTSWTRIHDVCFPFYDDDVMSGRRTLFHMPVGTRTEAWIVGDGLWLLSKPRSPRRKIGVVVDARKLHLRTELVSADLPKLCAPDIAAYLMRWDALHPELPSSIDPLVWRIEFRYDAWGRPDDPPEWSIAS